MFPSNPYLKPHLISFEEGKLHALRQSLEAIGWNLRGNEGGVAVSDA